MAIRVNFKIKSVSEEYRNDFDDDCMRHNVNAFCNVSVVVGFLDMAVVLTQRLLALRGEIYNLPYTYIFLLIGIINFIFYFIFSKNRNINEHNKKHVSALITIYMILQLGHSIFASVSSVADGYPQTALYSVLICYLAAGLSFRLRKVYIYIWTSFAALILAEIIFVSSTVTMPFILNVFFINLTVSLIAAVSNNNRIDVFLQKVFIAKQQEELETVNKKLQELTKIDGLTGISNRRAFDEKILTEWNKCRRLCIPLAVIMLDIDFFKLYNDLYGHSQGDVCLKTVAKALGECLRRSGDEVFRYGGEEFIMLLPNTNREGAKAVAQRAISTISQLNIPHGDTELKYVTISAGVHAANPGVTEMTHSGLVESADKALYLAKQNGRNRFEVFK